MDSTPEFTIAARPGQRLEEAPLDPTDVVRLSDGRYVVGDGAQSGWDALLVFDSTGRYMGRWGREGRGPGEFGQQYGVHLLRGDTVAGYDTTDRPEGAMGAYELYSPSGRFVRQLPRIHVTAINGTRSVRSTTAALRGIFEDGSLLMVRSERPQTFEQRDRELELQIEVFPTGAQGISVQSQRFDVVEWIPQDINYSFRPFAPRHHLVAGRTRWYYGDSRHFAVRVFSGEGMELHTLSRELRPERLTDEEKEEFILAEVERAKYAQGGDGVPRNAVATFVEETYRTKTRYPEYKALYSKILEDAEENVWIEHFRWPVERRVPLKVRQTRWSVFNRDGAFLGEVSMPSSFIVSSITANRVLGFFVDEHDVMQVRVYRLCRGDREC